MNSCNHGPSQLQVDLSVARNRCLHLERSNVELKLALATEKDQDYKSALQDNIVTIAKLRARIAALEEELNSVAAAQEDTNTVRLLASEEEALASGRGPRDMPLDDTQSTPPIQSTVNHSSLAMAAINMEVDEQGPGTSFAFSSETEGNPSARPLVLVELSGQSCYEHSPASGPAERAVSHGEGGSTQSLLEGQDIEPATAAGSTGAWL